MKRKSAVSKKPAIRLMPFELAQFRMQAVHVAANLRDAEAIGHAQSLGGYMRPGKTAEQVIAAAEKIFAFVTGGPAK